MSRIAFYNIEARQVHSVDTHSRWLIISEIGLLLDYCIRFYECQFTTCEVKDVIIRFEHLLDGAFHCKIFQEYGLPSVKYCADKELLSLYYSGDLISWWKGKTVTEHIQSRLNRSLTSKQMSEIAYNLCLSIHST